MTALKAGKGCLSLNFRMRRQRCGQAEVLAMMPSGVCLVKMAIEEFLIIESDHFQTLLNCFCGCKGRAAPYPPVWGWGTR